MTSSPTITAGRTVSMGHRLPSYAGDCASPHGHNVLFEVSVATHGQFVDFKQVDACLGAVLQDLDHAMVLHEADPLLPVLRGMGFRTVALSVEPTTEALAQLVFNEMSLRLAVECVVVHETAKYSSTVVEPNPEVRRV